MRFSENIEKIFLDDVRDKKRTGNGAYSKRGKGVKHRMGGIKTPYDFMKPKERRKLNGEVVVTRMYETILTRTEFELKDQETQKHMLTRWRELYTNEQIKEEMAKDGKKFSEQSFADLVNRLGCPRKPRGGARRGKRKTNAKKALSEPVSPIPTNEIISISTNSSPTRLLTNGLHLEYNGDYAADEIIKVMTKLQILVEGESNKFTLSLSLSERVKN